MAEPDNDPTDAAAVNALLDAMDGGDWETDHEEGKPHMGKGSRGPYTGYDDAIASTASFLSEQPRLVMGAVGILTRFSNLMQWPDAFFRLLRNGREIGDIDTAQVYARGSLTKEDLRKRNVALRKQYRSYKDHADLQEFTAANANYDTTGWNPPHGKPLNNNPPFLSDVSNGVVNWPQGEDRGIFTKVME